MLTRNNYGKCSVRLAKVTRRPDRHDFKDLTVAVRFEGDFEGAHVEGDNSKILPTDTMKNTVYALASTHALDEIEEFARALVDHFLANNPQVSRARVRIAEHLWSRIDVSGAPHPHAFVKAGGGDRTTTVEGTREGVTVESGVSGLVVLKTTDSAFEGFVKDGFTTLPEASDRIMATAIEAAWTYGEPDVAFGLYWRSVRQVLLDVFATHQSRSVQHTLYRMGEEVLDRFAEIEEIRLSLPNKHHLPFNLTPLGLENTNAIFVPTEEPFGLIEAVVTRGGSVSR
jgi:urate oxidase